MIVPGDTGKPWRYDKMIEYILAFPDELSPVVKNFFIQEDATKDDKVWWILLYSACYCVPTACVMYKELDYRTLTKKQLHRFWVDNKSKLLFQSDRRYIKNMDQFEDIVEEFIKRSHRKPWAYLSSMLRDSEEDTYTAMYKEVNSWKYYGRFGTVLFMYNVSKLLKIPMKGTEYDWVNGSTTTEAMFNALYKDNRADSFKTNSKLTDKDKERLNHWLNKTIRILEEKDPSKDWTVLGVTSDMCSYRKMYKCTRYLGYYVDRQQEEIELLQNNYPEYPSMWKNMWKARLAGISKEYLGEVNGWSGIQKDLCNAWLDRGEFR